MRATEIPDFKQLSGPGKILLADDIWDSIAADEANVPVPASRLRVLDRRLRRHAALPGELLALDELQRRIGR